MFFLENRNKHPTFLVSCTHKNNFMVEKKNNAHTHTHIAWGNTKVSDGKTSPADPTSLVLTLLLPWEPMTTIHKPRKRVSTNTAVFLLVDYKINIL